MSIRQIVRRNQPLREQLAAEYALGTLIGGARRRFETWLRDDAALRLIVAEWQDRLYPMAEFSPSVQAPAIVWRRISAKINLQKSSQSDRKSFLPTLRDKLSFWRNLGIASTALATILVAVLLARQGDVAAPATSYVAMLTNDQSQALALVTADPHTHRMLIKVVAQQTIAADKSLELWAVPKAGAPRSLGLIAGDGNITLPLPDNATPASIALLAVSLEPKGGSPNPNGPSGPIVFKGAWVKI